jgi:hypothetical protein
MAQPRPSAAFRPERPMPLRLVVSLAACVLLALACAPRSRATAADHEKSPPPAPTHGELATVLLPERRGADTEISLNIENTGAKLVELRFPSGHTHDFVVLDANEREVWRWSEGRMFTQALQTKQLKRGDVLAYSATWKDAPPGQYTLVASVRSDTHPIELRRPLLLP